MRTRNPAATCTTCPFYIPQGEGRRSQCRSQIPDAVIVTTMRRVGGTVIETKNTGQLQPVMSVEFPVFSPPEDFWCGAHPDLFAPVEAV